MQSNHMDCLAVLSRILWVYSCVCVCVCWGGCFEVLKCLRLEHLNFKGLPFNT